MKKVRVAVVGVTGVVGRTVLKVLEEEKLPIDEYILMASARSAGKKIKFIGNEYEVQELTEHSFDEHIDYAIFSAGGATSKQFSPIAAKHGCVVIDNSNAFRMDKDVPLVVPEVNPEEITNNKGIIANPNCSTIQAVVPLKALDDKYIIKRIVYSTYQAVSGAGRYGVEDLENGTENYREKKDEFDNINIAGSEQYDLKKFPYPIFNNCLPHIDVFEENGYTREEMKMVNETRKILKHADLPVTATAVRVPIFNSHCESVNVELEKDFELEELKQTLRNFEGIVVIDGKDEKSYPISTEVSGHNEVYVGRIRRDESVKSGVNLWIVADNIRKGAATNAIQILKKLLEK
ncbi:MAG: aspartate-semialdehyde dehydrogenase [Clostridia bacterium]|nr:aspartate-semialdehyde dehydrogenase [Clostridia bacterium]